MLLGKLWSTDIMCKGSMVGKLWSTITTQSNTVVSCQQNGSSGKGTIIKVPGLSGSSIVNEPHDQQNEMQRTAEVTQQVSFYGFFF